MYNFIKKFKLRKEIRYHKLCIQACQELYVEGTWDTDDQKADSVYNTVKGRLVHANHELALLTN